MPKLSESRFKHGHRHNDMYIYCMNELNSADDEMKVKEWLVMNTDIPVQEIMYQVRRIMIKKGLIDDIGKI